MCEPAGAARWHPQLVTRAALLAALASGPAGCGGDDRTVVTATPPAPPDAPQTSLTITIDAGDDEPPVESTLACDPAGGTHPDPEAACVALAELDAGAFLPVAADPDEYADLRRTADGDGARHLAG